MGGGKFEPVLDRHNRTDLRTFRQKDTSSTIIEVILVVIIFLALRVCMIATHVELVHVPVLDPFLANVLQMLENFLSTARNQYGG